MEKRNINTVVNMFLSELFAFRNDVHLAHLNVHGPAAHAAHIALNELYDAILEFADELVETYQGQYGLCDLTIRSSNTLVCKDPCQVVEKIIQFVNTNRACFIDSHLQNIVDELIASVYKVYYKLENLK